jgi:hypothetical protein
MASSTLRKNPYTNRLGRNCQCAVRHVILSRMSHDRCVLAAWQMRSEFCTAGALSFPHGFSQLRWKRGFLFSRGRLNVMSLRHLPFHYPAGYYWALANFITFT